MPAEHLVQQFILVVCIGLGLILYSEVLSRYIGHHGSAVYVGMVVVVRIYNAMQRKASATVLQDLNLARRKYGVHTYFDCP